MKRCSRNSDGHGRCLERSKGFKRFPIWRRASDDDDDDRRSKRLDCKFRSEGIIQRMEEIFCAKEQHENIKCKLNVLPPSFSSASLQLK